jgi:ABC-type branched-subunit amino acid transport system substrate-binding protein
MFGWDGRVTRRDSEMKTIRRGALSRRRALIRIASLLATGALASAPAPPPAHAAARQAAPAAGAPDTIRVGGLHSLSGTMALSGAAVRDATLLAVDELNAHGGVPSTPPKLLVEAG